MCHRLALYLIKMLPETIGRYKIKEELGRSQATIVYRALDTQANREVVVKLFALEPTGDTARDMSLKAHFRRELKIIASLEHSAIVPVYDVGEQNGQPYFVMRYMAGGSLNRLIAKKGRLSLQETAQVIDRIVLALDSAHKQHIIHRDIKPDNILFDLDGHPYISDFGVAKPNKDDGSEFEGMIGTPGYMAPEQINNGDVDERTDVYGLGVVIYQMLSGKPPFGNEANVSSSKDNDQKYTIPNILSDVPELPPEMEEFVNITLAEEKQHRYVTTLDLARALNRIAFGEDYVSAARERQKSRGSPLRTSLIWIFGSLAFLVAFFWMFAREGNIPFLSVASTPTKGLIPSETSSPQNDAVTFSPPTVTETLEPTLTLEPTPANVYPGAADQVALLSGNQIYLMNTDGSGLTQVRSENSPKSNLQWIPENRLVYMSRNCAYLLDAETKQTQQLSCFGGNEQLEGFRVSDDGKFVAISVQRTLNILPFDQDFLKSVNTRFNLLDNEDNCFYNHMSFLEILWSADQTRLAAHVIDTRLANSDQIFLLNADIPNCANVNLTRIDTIPGGRIDFDTDSSKRIGSFDWDGQNLFLINDSIRNDGFGNLYLYNSETTEVTKINPIKGQCCYRDPQWSPDGSYIIFAYQGFDRSAIELYYIPFEDIQNGGEYQPIQLPSDFFTSARDKPQPALRIAP